MGKKKTPLIIVIIVVPFLLLLLGMAMSVICSLPVADEDWQTTQSEICEIVNQNSDWIISIINSRN